ncbi:MAG TPA: DUF4304 domain-containing protein [Longimicrobium sp.]|nr:DUF4304 domain-containing protein [Longimicrobium sp.]
MPGSIRPRHRPPGVDGPGTRMTAKTAHAASLDAVRDYLARYLKPQGFRSRGRTFNRSTEPGVIQVIGLQLGATRPGGSQPRNIPEEFGLGMRGTFTVNLGLYVDEVREALAQAPRPGWVTASHCALCTRIGQLADPPRDIWWKLEGTEPGELASDVVRLLDAHGLALLEACATREGILAELASQRAENGLNGQLRVTYSILLAGAGRLRDAREQLRAEITASEGSPVYQQTLRELALRLHLPL